MKRIPLFIILAIFTSVFANAQSFNSISEDGFGLNEDETSTFSNRNRKDSTEVEKVIPKGMHVWVVDPLFGDRTAVDRDTVQHLFMNSIFTEGQYGQYNTTGNLGAPRQNRIFIDRKAFSDFQMENAYDYFLTPIDELRFTNTLSPITNLNFNSCGDKINGEDHLNVKFAANAGKRIGFGMKFNYVYGLGYYSNQSNALFDWTFWGSYLGDRYQAHLAFTTDHMKMTENGGITNDDYITHPELFTDNYISSEIPVNLNKNWNRIDALHGFLTHRYSVGFYKKVPMTAEEIEARKFAMKAEQEKAELATKKAVEMDLKGNAEPKFAGRPDDAKIAGDLKADSLGNLVPDTLKNDRIEINDSILAAMKTQKEDTSWLKDEYVPVTSFIHTLKIDTHSREYRAHLSPNNYYKSTLPLYDTVMGDSVSDVTDHFVIRNTFAIALLEGFNKWAKSGLKAYLTHDFQHFKMPDTVSVTKSYNENSVYAGAQLVKAQGRIFHYNLIGELGVVGENIGNVKVDFNGDVNIPLFGDTTKILLKGFFHNEKPSFFYRHFHGKHFWWDNGDDLSKQIHTHVEGQIAVQKTNTVLRLAYDNLENYTYMGVTNDIDATSLLPVRYDAQVRQASSNISLLTAELCQDFRFGILNWENRVTFQKSSAEETLPVPTLNVWYNLYLNFSIAKVLRVHFGGEAVYFTKYYAPEWVGGVASYAVQENEAVRKKVGGYPFVNVYANFLLKGCRFFVMMSHVNAGTGNMNYFTTPHHPMNDRIFRLGLSWYFNN